jgi:ubiquinone biosynthesis protein
MLRTIKNLKRLLGIATIVASENALFIFDELRVLPVLGIIGRLLPSGSRSKGERLAAALEKLGPTFIKLGQALSTRSDLIGDELADALSRLRDKLPPFPTQTTIAIIESEFAAPLSSLYSEFSSEPVAAASIAQVHKAKTKDGRDVAVKILRPEIEKAFARDLELFFWLAEIIERRLSDSKRFKPKQVVATFKETVFFELDLRFEAAAATELANNIKKHEPGFRVPSIDWSLTSQRVMTLEWIDGIPMNDIEAIRASGFDTDEILAKAARSLFSQVFVDGYFHADLHPGNLFVDKNGDIAAVDFGIMGRLDWDSRLYMAEILRGFLTQDYRHVAKMHFKAGYVPSGKSLEAFTQACMAVAQPIVGKPVNEISVAHLLGQMFNIAAEFEMETQPQLLLLQKTMMVTEGVGRMLNPKLNMWELTRPLVENWAREHFGVKAQIKDGVDDAMEIARKIPQVLRSFETALARLSSPEGLQLHPDSIQKLNEARSREHRQWLQLAWAALALAATLGLLQLL